MVLHIPRSEFLEDYFDYNDGEHLNLLSPTGGGKTRLKRQLLAVARRQNPWLDYAAMMPKPNDPTTTEMVAEMGLKVHERYPFTKHWWEPKPPGHVLWPPHIRNDEAANREHLSKVFRGALSDLYWKGNCIVDADDVYLLAAIYKLNPELEMYWTAGRSNGAGLWTANQKPSGTVQGAVSTFSYSAPTHLFLGRDTDDRNIARFGEIGMGFDKRDIEAIVRNLRVRTINKSAVTEFLYLDRRGPHMAVVGID